MPDSHHHSIETRESWVVATAAVVIMGMGFGGAWITAVALKVIAAEVGGVRSIPSAAGSLAWFGSAIGGLLMGRAAQRFGTRWTVISGAVMIALGLSVSTLHLPWGLYAGHAIFIGLFGIGAINAPMYIYVAQWFDKRRGSALALISSGIYLAGALWPPVFERLIAYVGWRQTMLWYGALVVAVVVPLALLFFRPPPEGAHADAVPGHKRPTKLGLPRNAFFLLMCAAGVMCCIPMAMPQAHLVAFCSDVGLGMTIGAVMLSVLLGTAVFSRQVWGLISDRIGGMQTILIGSTWQAIAMTGFLLTQSEAGLFTVSLVFGLGFSGLIPAYVLAVRDLFPGREAYWRIPTMLMCTGAGMAIGGWLAGMLYDYYGYYAPAFAAGVGINIINIMIVALLVWRQHAAARA